MGVRVVGRNPIRSEVDENLPEPDEAKWREVYLVLKKSNGRVPVENVKAISYRGYHSRRFRRWAEG